MTEDGTLIKFRELYTKLCNFASTEDEVKKLKVKMCDMITEEAIAEAEKVTSDVVKKACGGLKPGKSDVSDSYESDVFLHVQDTMSQALSAVFRSLFLVHGTVTLSVLNCAFLPLYKVGHKKSRPIHVIQSRCRSIAASETVGI